MSVIVGWDGDSRYMVADVLAPSQSDPVRVVDLDAGTVMDPIALGSVLAHSEPDEWTDTTTGPRAAEALALATS